METEKKDQRQNFEVFSVKRTPGSGKSARFSLHFRLRLLTFWAEGPWKTTLATKPANTHAIRMNGRNGT